MARFSRDCVNRMNSLVSKLELVLGPDTGDLQIRVGKLTFYLLDFLQCKILI